MACIRLLAGTLFVHLLVCPVLAQSPSRPALTKADQIAMSIDLLWNVRAAVTKFEQSRRLILFRAIGVRVTHCSLVYAILSSISTYDAATKAAFKGSSDSFTLAGSFLFPEGLEAYKAMVNEAKLNVERLRSDQPALLKFLQDCRALSGSEDDALKVVTEISSSDRPAR